MNHYDLARQIRRNLQPPPGVHGPWQFGEVATLDTTSGTVGVYLDNSPGGDGAAITSGIPYLDSYSPYVGDPVLVARMVGAGRSQRVVICSMGGSGTGGPRGRLNATGQTVAATATAQKVTLANVDINNGNIDALGFSSKIVIDEAGCYLVSACAGWQNSGGAVAAGRYMTMIYVNGAEVRRAEEDINASGFPVVPVSDIMNLAVNDYIELYVYQTSGVNQATQGDTHQTWLSAVKLNSSGGGTAAVSFGSPVEIGTALADGSAATSARSDHVHSGLGQPIGLTGATAATRFVGGTTSGAPASGTFAVGDFVIDQSGSAWVCTTAGTPGTWTQMGGGGAAVPDVVQVAEAWNTATSVTIAAASSGHSLIMVTNSTTGQVTSPSCTNVTWTQLLTHTSAGAFYAIWVGVVAGGSSGTTITMTKPGSFNTVVVLEVPDSLTPVAGTTGHQSTLNGVPFATDLLRVTGCTAGRLVVFAAGEDNTTQNTLITPNVPSMGIFSTVNGIAMAVGYVSGSVASLFSQGSVGASLICEVY